MLELKQICYFLVSCMYVAGVANVSYGVEGVVGDVIVKVVNSCG